MAIKSIRELLVKLGMESLINEIEEEFKDKNIIYPNEFIPSQELNREFTKETIRDVSGEVIQEIVKDNAVVLLCRYREIESQKYPDVFSKVVDPDVPNESLNVFSNQYLDTFAVNYGYQVLYLPKQNTGLTLAVLIKGREKTDQQIQDISSTVVDFLGGNKKLSEIIEEILPKDNENIISGDGSGTGLPEYTFDPEKEIQLLLDPPKDELTIKESEIVYIDEYSEKHI